MYLGLDLGTSGLKAILIDERQRRLGTAAAKLPVSRPQAGWSEQDPAEWIRAAEAVLDALRRAHGAALAAVKGIGLSGQMHGATLLDQRDRVLRPCILWNDTRSHGEAASLDAEPRFRAISGNTVFPGFTAPKLVWVKTHEPATFERTRWVLLPKDYLRLWLTGERVSEMSDAAGTSWLDVANRRWSQELLGASGMELRQMPWLVEGSDSSGVLRGELARRWGMGASVVVAGGASDNAAAAIGLGVIGPGRAFVSLGTSGVIFAATEACVPNAASAVHIFCHALPATWHQMGVILSATAALEWLAGVTGASATQLTKELGDELRPPSGVTCLPYFSGERTPHNDALIRGVFAGIGHESDRKSLTQAVLEGVAFAFRDCTTALHPAVADASCVSAIGGGARSRYWLKAIATSLDTPVQVHADADSGAAFGAARLGLMAATGASARAVCTAQPAVETIEPDRALRRHFEDAYQRFRALYPAIRGAIQ